MFCEVFKFSVLFCMDFIILHLSIIRIVDYVVICTRQMRATVSIFTASFFMSCFYLVSISHETSNIRYRRILHFNTFSILSFLDHLGPASMLVVSLVVCFFYCIPRVSILMSSYSIFHSFVWHCALRNSIPVLLPDLRLSPFLLHFLLATCFSSCI